MILARWKGLVLFSKNSIISTNSIMLNTIWVEHRKHEILMNSALKIKRNSTLIRKTGIIKQKQCSKHLWVERQKHEILMKSAFWNVYDANMSLVRECIANNLTPRESFHCWFKRKYEILIKHAFGVESNLRLSKRVLR